MTPYLKAVSAGALLYLAIFTAGCRETASESADSAQEGAAVQQAMDLYMEGLIAQDASRIPLASDVTFVAPDGSTREGIDKVAPFLEAQNIDDIRVHQTLINGEYGCELTDYYWTDGPKTPIAICFRVEAEKITEIRPYFDRTLFDED